MLVTYSRLADLHDLSHGVILIPLEPTGLIAHPDLQIQFPDINMVIPSNLTFEIVFQFHSQFQR